MELLLMLLQLLIGFIPFYIVLVYAWSLCYLWTPYDLLLLEECGHSAGASNVTSKIIINKRASNKGDQKPTKERTEKTVVTDDLIQPVQCSGEGENSKGSSTQCSEHDNQSQLVVAMSTLARQFNTRRCLSVVPDDKQEQVSPPVAASKYLTPQVPPTALREPEMAPDTKIVDSNLPTIKETHNTCAYDSRYQDGCDDDSEEYEEDEEEERNVAQSYSYDFEKKEEMLIFQGPLLCTSDTKIDQAGKEKEIVQVMTEGGDNFTSPQVTTTEGNQTCVEEVNNNTGLVSTKPSTILSTPASNGLVDATNQTDQPTQEENSNSDGEILPHNLSDHTSPND